MPALELGDHMTAGQPHAHSYWADAEPGAGHERTAVENDRGSETDYGFGRAEQDVVAGSQTACNSSRMIAYVVVEDSAALCAIADSPYIPVSDALGCTRSHSHWRRSLSALAPAQIPVAHDETASFERIRAQALGQRMRPERSNTSPAGRRNSCN